MFADDPRIEVITGDAASIMSSRGPFDLLFADSGVRDERDLPPCSACSALAAASSWTT
jgi:predicted O-methyltransferase YrrM